MNPADLGMVWMTQFGQVEDQMYVDDSRNYFAQPTIGMSVLDDLSQQSSSMVSWNSAYLTNQPILHPSVIRLPLVQNPR